MANENNKPVKKYQAGGISGAVWKNATTLQNGKDIESLSVTLDRRYKDSNGNWKSSSSFRQNDIPKVVLVLSKAYEFMVLKGKEDNGDMTEEEVVA